MDRLDNLTNIQKMILGVLESAEKPVSAHYIGNRLGLSAKTVRSNITGCSKILKKHGVSIISRRGSGFYLSASDDTISALNEKYGVGKTTSRLIPSDDIYAHWLIRQLLMGISVMSIDDVSEKLYINPTSVKKIVSKCRDLLSQFALELQFHKKQGFQIRGSEMSMRLCMAYEENIALHDPIEKDMDYLHFLGHDTDVRKRLNELIIKYQNAFEGYNVSAYSVNYISALLYADMIRNQKNKHLRLEHMTVESFTNRNTYYVAKMVISELQNQLGVSFPREDTIFLAIAFVAMRITLISPRKLRVNYLQDKDAALDIVMNLAIVNDFDSIGKDIDLIESFAGNIDAILTRSHFHFITSQFQFTEEVPSYSAMARRLALQAGFYIEKTWKRTVSTEDMIRIAHLIYPIFGRYKWVFPRIDACVISAYDKLTGTGIKERLLRNFSIYLKNIDVLEQYEINESILNKYKVVFYDSDTLMLPKSNNEIAFVPVKLNFDEVDKIRIRKILVSHSNVSPDSDLALWDHVSHISRAVTGNKFDECLQQIEKVICQDNGMEEDIARDVLKCERKLPSLSVNNTVLLTGSISHTLEASMYFFILPKPISWHEGRVRMFIYWDRGMKPDQANLFENEYLPHMIECLRNDSAFIENFIEDPSKQKLVNAIYSFSDRTLANANSFV